MTVPVEQVTSGGRPVRGRRRVPALPGALAVTAAAVVAVTALLPGPQAGGALTVAHWLRARLLAAIDAARSDILSAQVRLPGPGSITARQRARQAPEPHPPGRPRTAPGFATRSPWAISRSSGVAW